MFVTILDTSAPRSTGILKTDLPFPNDFWAKLQFMLISQLSHSLQVTLVFGYLTFKNTSTELFLTSSTVVVQKCLCLSFAGKLVSISYASYNTHECLTQVFQSHSEGLVPVAQYTLLYPMLS